jgi:lipid-binding SYLF domain-containing protein
MLEKQQYVREMRGRTLGLLYQSRPDLEERVRDAAGYGVFSNVNIHLLLLGTGHGYGVVVDNSDDTETFMRMAEVGAGFGAGLKDLRAVFVFPTEEVMETFTTKGWSFASQAQAVAKVDDKGAGVSASADVLESGASGSIAGESSSTLASTSSRGIEIYRLTKSGVALNATLAGTRYWRDKRLTP